MAVMLTRKSRGQPTKSAALTSTQNIAPELLREYPKMNQVQKDIVGYGDVPLLVIAFLFLNEHPMEARSDMFTMTRLEDRALLTNSNCARSLILHIAHWQGPTSRA